MPIGRGNISDSPGGGGGPIAANLVILDTTNFDGALGPGDVNVQIAMETLDDAIPATLSGAGSPDGVVNGAFGQGYYDTTNLLWYKCTSDPSGLNWTVI